MVERNARALRASVTGIGPSRMRGQALTEMAVLAVVLVPLFLLIPLLGKYAHIQQTTQQAARAAAWEATVTYDYEMDRLDRARQRELLIERHFGHADAQIATTNETPPEDDVRLGGSMFNTHSDQPLVERADIVLSDYAFEDQPGLVAGALSYFPDWLPGEFPPSRNGLVTASLQVSPQNLRYADGTPADGRNFNPFDSIDLEFNASHTLLADPWGAAGAGVQDTALHTRRRAAYQQVRTLVPSTNVSFLGDALDGLDWVPDILPVIGALKRLRPGYARHVMDVVPEDRLQDYPGGP